MSAAFNNQPSAGASSADRELLSALTSGGNDRAVGLRTRRAVFNASREMQAGRAIGRRNLFIALLTAGAVTLLLLPAIWSGLNELLSGATLVDMPVMLAALGMMLFSGVGAALFLLRDDRRVSRSARHPRG
jgi:hypothetical protein